MCTWGPQWATVCGTGTGPKLANKFLCIMTTDPNLTTVPGTCCAMPGGLDRATIEAILHAVSRSCREEVEAALDQPMEISAGCKLEIKAALASHSQASVEPEPPQAHQPDNLDRGGPQHFPSAGGSSRAPRAAAAIREAPSETLLLSRLSVSRHRVGGRRLYCFVLLPVRLERFASRRVPVEPAARRPARPRAQLPRSGVQAEAQTGGSGACAQAQAAGRIARP